MIIYNLKKFCIIISFDWYIFLTVDKADLCFIEEDGFSDWIRQRILSGGYFSGISCCTRLSGLISCCNRSGYNFSGMG
jgi:hypothetical protein